MIVWLDDFYGCVMTIALDISLCGIYTWNIGDLL